MILGLLKNIFSLLAGISLIKFIIKTIWILLLTTISCFLIMKYFSPNMITDFSKNATVQIEKKVKKEIYHIKNKPSSKKVIKKFKNWKKKLITGIS